jgi:hypothetical protein
MHLALTTWMDWSLVVAVFGTDVRVYSTSSYYLVITALLPFSLGCCPVFCGLPGNVPFPADTFRVPLPYGCWMWALRR